MNDLLIDQLVNDLNPKKPLLNKSLWKHCTICLVAVIIVILSFMGLRLDHLAAMQNGAMFWKPLIFFTAWLGSILLITDISRPQGGLKKRHIIPLVTAGMVFLWQFFMQRHSFSWDDITLALNHTSALVCVSMIMGFGLMTMIIIWKYWLLKTATEHPTLLGGLAGFSAGCLSATAYALHCNHDTILYISVYYILPILLLCLMGAYMGRKFLRW
ncbi:MAG: NrsF family protein [Emcibacter sp.]|nr:NrsF family protein [Emcibacter sp.]